ncbi:MAG: arginase family protein, partial [bacterium]|nr:arginase family protein [bacterium]
SFWVQTGNLNSLESDRVEIYPYAHKPTLTLFKRVPDNVSISVDRGWGLNKIHWQELKNKDLTAFFYALLDRLKTKKVYVSVDKDCLKSAYSVTNWEEGCFELNELLILLKLIRDNLDVIGMDITGEYSPPEVKGKIKTLFSRLDHPRDYSARNKPDPWISSINEQTNMKILELFLQK